MSEIDRPTPYDQFLLNEYARRRKRIGGAYSPFGDIHIFLQDAACPPWASPADEKGITPPDNKIYEAQISVDVAISRELVNLGDSEGIVQFTYFTNPDNDLKLLNSISTLTFIKNSSTLKIVCSNPGLARHKLFGNKKILFSKGLDEQLKSNEVLGQFNIFGNQLIY